MTLLYALLSVFYVISGRCGESGHYVGLNVHVAGPFGEQKNTRTRDREVADQSDSNFNRDLSYWPLGPGTNCSAIFGKFRCVRAIKKFGQLCWEI